MANLASLPNELKSAIISQVPFQDKLNLTQICKSIRLVAYPLLFHEITLNVDDVPLEHSCLRLSQLLYALLQDPSLAQNVKQVHITSRGCIRYFFQDRLYDRRKTGKPAFMLLKQNETLPQYDQLLADLNLPHRKIWENSILYKTDIHAIIALVISQCMHLKSLKIEYGAVKNVDWIPLLFRQGLNHTKVPQRIPTFDQLTEISLNCSNSASYHGTLLPLLFLPQLTDLTIGCLSERITRGRYRNDDDVKVCWLQDSLPTSNKLTALRLPECKVNSDTIEFLLHEHQTSKS